MDSKLFIVQPYIAKASGLVAQPARLFDDEPAARRAGRNLSRFRAGVVVLSQRVDPLAAINGRPEALAVYGRVPAAWDRIGKAA